MNEGRQYDDVEARREKVPLLIGVTGPSGAGKSFSMLRLLTGIQSAVGGDIGCIDTESKRLLHYADRFKFRHMDLRAPFSPLDYLGAIQHFVSKGIRIIGVDSMTHEHTGEGGVMDQSEKYLDRKAGDDEAERHKLFMGSLKEPKAQRRKLNDAIVHMGINAVFCYRAHEKVKPVQGQGIKNLGWMPETTSPLVYEMTARFLLLPASDGKPAVDLQTPAEKMLIKNPEQFRGWFNPGIQLTEDLGQRMAEWAAGVPAAPAEQCRPVDELAAAGDALAAEGIVKLRAWWEGALTAGERKLLGGRLDGWKRQAAEIAA